MLKNEHEKYENLEISYQREKSILEDSITKFKDLYEKALKKKVDSQFEKLDKQISQIDPNLMKKTGKLLENKLYTHHYNNLEEIKSNERLVNMRLLEMQSEENLKNLPTAFENKIVIDSFLTKKLDDIKEMNLLVDNYTKVMNFNSQDIVENISNRLKKELSQHLKNTNQILDLSQNIVNSNLVNVFRSDIENKVTNPKIVINNFVERKTEIHYNQMTNNNEEEKKGKYLNTKKESSSKLYNLENELEKKEVTITREKETILLKSENNRNPKINQDVKQTILNTVDNIKMNKFENINLFNHVVNHSTNPPNGKKVETQTLSTKKDYNIILNTSKNVNTSKT